MNTQPQGFFTDRANALNASSKLPNFPIDFVGRVRVDLCKGITTNKGPAFIAEFTVLTSNKPDSVYVGGRYSWFQGNLQGQYSDTAYQACIGFMLAAMGLDEGRDAKEIESEKHNQSPMLNAIISDNAKNVFPFQKRQPDGSLKPDPKSGFVNPLAGAEVNLQTSEKKKKLGKELTIEACREKGLIFTLHSFSPVAKAAQAA